MNTTANGRTANMTTTTTGAHPQRYDIDDNRPAGKCSDGEWMRSDEVSSYLEHLESQLEQQQARVSSTLREHARVCNVLVDVAARCPPVVERQPMQAQQEDQMRSEAAAAAAEERDTAYYRLGMERAKADGAEENARLNRLRGVAEEELARVIRLLNDSLVRIQDLETDRYMQQWDGPALASDRVDNATQSDLWATVDPVFADVAMGVTERVYLADAVDAARAADAAQEEAVGQRGLRLSCEDMAQEEIDRWKQEVQMLRDAAQAIVDIGRVDLSLQSYNTVWRAFSAAFISHRQEIQS